MFNIISLTLGAAAVLFPVIAPVLQKGKAHLFSAVSLSCGMLALYAGICEYNRRVEQSDFSALLDTSGFLTHAYFIFTIIVIAENVILYYKSRK